ncbi:restriction endonuclease subunit S [Limosilactobacillus fermentum]
MKEQKKKVPELRFKGFTDDWEQRKLGTIYDFGKGKGLPLDSFIYSSNNPAIAYGHLYTKYSEVISEVFWSSNDDNGVLSKDNDLLFPGSSTVPNGTAQANAITLNNVKLGGDIIIGRPKEGVGVLSTFMSYQVNSQRQKLFPITVGTTITHMYGKDISKLNFFITDYSEQEKISSFFKQLDDTIALQQRKLELLKEIKKGLLQKMFAEKNSKQPVLRFKGFHDDWEQRKFSEILAKSDGLRRGPFGSALKKEFFISSSEYTVYEQNNAIYNTWKTRYFITPEKFQELHKFQLMPGDFILSGAGTIGRIAQVPANITKGVFNQALIRIRINPEWMDKKFFLIWMQSENMQRKLTQANPGSAMTNLVPMSEIKKWEIIIPSKAEQNKIGEFIQKLNSLIALQQRKQNHLKLLKKSLLQQMFM